MEASLLLLNSLLKTPVPFLGFNLCQTREILKTKVNVKDFQIFMDPHHHGKVILQKTLCWIASQHCTVKTTKNSTQIVAWYSTVVAVQGLNEHRLSEWIEVGRWQSHLSLERIGLEHLAVKGLLREKSPDGGWKCDLCHPSDEIHRLSVVSHLSVWYLIPWCHCWRVGGCLNLQFCLMSQKSKILAAS